MHPLTRRSLLRNGMTTAVLLPIAGLLAGTRAFAQGATLDPADPMAQSLGYVTASQKPDQKCASCSLYQGKAGDAQGPCTIFAGKNVSADGWCKSWMKKS